MACGLIKEALIYDAEKQILISNNLRKLLIKIIMIIMAILMTMPIITQPNES